MYKIHVYVPTIVYDLTCLMDLRSVTTSDFAENLWNNVEPALTKTQPFHTLPISQQVLFCFDGIGGLCAPNVQTFVLVRGKCLELRRQWELGAATPCDDLVVGHDVLANSTAHVLLGQLLLDILMINGQKVDIFT